MFVRIAMITYTWTSYTHFFFWTSIVAYGIFLLIYQSYLTFSYNLYGIAAEMAVLPVVWWLIVLVPTGSATMELAITLFKREFFPTVVDIVAEIDSGHGAFSGTGSGSGVYVNISTHSFLLCKCFARRTL